MLSFNVTTLKFVCNFGYRDETTESAPNGKPPRYVVCCLCVESVEEREFCESLHGQNRDLDLLILNPIQDYHDNCKSCLQ